MSILLTSIAAQRRRYDREAAAYCGAVSVAGGHVTVDHKRMISDFVTAEKIAGRWANHRRIVLPIWGNAAANAIDMVTLESGTWVGSVTHGAGYVQGDGVTGYFDFGKTLAQLGITPYNGSLTALSLQEDNREDRRVLIGVRSVAPSNSVVTLYDITEWGPDMRGTIGDSSTLQQAASPRVGLFCTAATNDTAKFLIRRHSGGVSVVAQTNAGSLHPSTLPEFTLYGMSRHTEGVEFGTIDSHYNGRIGLWAVGLPMTQTQAGDFTLNIKTLWESLTGQTIP